MDRPDLDDDTYMAIQRLNNPDAVAAVEDGTNSCPCPRCNRLRQIMTHTPRTIDATDSTPNGVDAIKRMFEGLGFDVEVVQPGEPTPRGWNESFGADSMKSDGIRPGSFQAMDWPFEDEDEDDTELRQARKDTPVASGVIAYFPKALCAVAQVSKVGNDQHNPGEHLHWAREKSTDEADALQRHLLDFLGGEEHDTDGTPHLAKVAWRALALLERFLDGEYVDGYRS